jgi:hypothetical protein
MTVLYPIVTVTVNITRHGSEDLARHRQDSISQVHPESGLHSRPPRGPERCHTLWGPLQ